MTAKVFKKIWCGVLIITLLFSFSGCDNDDASQNVPAVNTPEDNSETELSANDEIIFSDFLVERCVRKTLNKGWNDKITKEEAASIKTLLIEPIYDPSIGMNLNATMSSLTFYEGYIDLIDLKYLTGIEVLKIDNLVEYDMVVNVDSISNCKKLKRLYMQWNPTLCNAYSGVGYGYKYLANIIAELPDLEYIDLGIYVDSHMKAILLSKTSNKKITFYNGHNDRYAAQVLNKYSAFHPNPMEITDAEEYESTMKYEYIGTDVDLNSNNEEVSGIIPVIKVNSYDELQQSIDIISDATEDLCICLWKECTKFDCKLLSKFQDLTTLTIIKEGTYLSYLTQKEGYERTELINTKTIEEMPYLQVINLGACIGDISYLKNIKNLRELTLSACDVTGINCLGELKKLTEFKIFSSECGSIKSEFEKTKVKELNNLKYYRYWGNEEATSNYMNALLYMPNLCTLSLPGEITDLSTLKICSNLENLYIEGLKMDTEYNIKEIASLSKLKTVGIKIGKITNVSDILKMPNLVSVVLPMVVYYADSDELNKLVKNAASHDNLSLFAIVKGDEADYAKVSKFNKESLKQLYDKGICDGLVQLEIIERSDIKEKTFEDAWKEIEKRAKTNN